MWFDLIEPFQFDSKRRVAFCTVVYKNGKYNFINQKGKILSSIWFDRAVIWNIGAGKGKEWALGGVIKNNDVLKLPNNVGKYKLDFNPEKFTLYRIDPTEKITIVPYFPKF